MSLSFTISTPRKLVVIQQINFSGVIIDIIKLLTQISVFTKPVQFQQKIPAELLTGYGPPLSTALCMSSSSQQPKQLMFQAFRKTPLKTSVKSHQNKHLKILVQRTQGEGKEKLKRQKTYNQMLISNRSILNSTQLNKALIPIQLQTALQLFNITTSNGHCHQINTHVKKMHTPTYNTKDNISVKNSWPRI